MLNRYTVSLMLICVLVAWDRYTAAETHEKPKPPPCDTVPMPDPPIWDVVIGDGYVRAVTQPVGQNR